MPPSHVYPRCVQEGSYGTCVFNQNGLGNESLTALPYFRLSYHAPFAVYHVLYLGVAKDFIHFVIKRVTAPQTKDGIVEPSTAPVLPVLFPLHAKSTLVARLQQSRLRSAPSCGAVNFLEHVGAMTISEVQLWLEVLSPFLFHDMEAYGFKADLLVMWSVPDL